MKKFIAIFVMAFLGFVGASGMALSGPTEPLVPERGEAQVAAAPNKPAHATPRPDKKSHLDMKPQPDKRSDQKPDHPNMRPPKPREEIPTNNEEPPVPVEPGACADKDDPPALRLS